MGAALLAITGCAHSTENQTAAHTTQPPPAQAQSHASSSTGSKAPSGTGQSPQEIEQLRLEVKAQADNAEYGKVRQLADSTLVVTPSDGSADNTYSMGNRVPIFDANSRVGTEALQPGMNVRVYYQTPADGSQPRVVGLEVMPSDTTTTPGMTPQGMGSPPPMAPSDNTIPDMSHGQNSGSTPADNQTSP